MKIKKPRNSSHIEIRSSHVVSEDEVTGELEIEEFELKFNGPLSEWIIEYLDNPVGSRLHKNLVRTFKTWFES